MKEDTLLFFREMSSYELYDSYLNVRSVVNSDTALLMSFLFAYLSVAYFISPRLTRFQSLSVSTLYSFSYFFMAYSVFEGIMQMAMVVYAWTDELWRFEFIMIWAYIVAGVWTIAWIVSLVLFVQRRNSPDV